MTRPLRRFAILVSAASCAIFGPPAVAQSAAERDYCPSRPGLGTTPCTIAPGRISLEIGLADWQRTDTPQTRTDTFTAADTIIRAGVSERVEIIAGWTAIGRERVRDLTSGEIRTDTGIGDLMLGAKFNLANPDGDRLSFAIQPFVSAPVGRTPIGAGGWEGGVLAPFNLALGSDVTFELQPAFERRVNDDGPGHHWAYSGTMGVTANVAQHVSTVIEVQAERDDDPADHMTTIVGALSLGWMATDDLQWDVGTIVGLNHAAPDVELYVGVSRQF